MKGNEFILLKRMNHFGLWIHSKYNLKNMHSLLMSHNNQILEKTRRFFDETVFGRKVPHRLFKDGVSSRVTQIMDKNKRMFVVEQPSKFREYVLEALDEQKGSRHYRVLSFILEYYENAIAIEVPVWCQSSKRIVMEERMEDSKTKTNIKTEHPLSVPPFLHPIVGHLDLLCYEHPYLFIRDYKPNASKVNASSQLSWYRRLYCELLKIDIRHVKIGWFDEQKEYIIEEPIIEFELL